VLRKTNRRRSGLLLKLKHIMKYYPTKRHEKAAKKLVDIFSKDERIASILLIASCARGKASKDSCLDVCFIVKDRNLIKAVAKKFEKKSSEIKELREIHEAGQYSHIDLHITDGKVKIPERDWTSGPDEYELEIGNIFVYSVALFNRGNYFEKLKKKYLPYYSQKLQKERLAEVKKYMFNNLDHIPLYVRRGLYFSGFSRLYNASKEFLQALFIKRKTYPISYDKWIKEQLVEILKEPKIYKDFVGLLEIKDLESDELIRKAQELNAMAKRYL